MKDILVCRYTTVIDAPIELVFDCVNKDEHVLKWSTMVLENIYEGDNEDLRLGSKYISKQKLDKKTFEFECEIIELKQPYLSTVQSKTKEGISTTRYHLAETEYGTELTVEAFLQPSNLYYKIVTMLTKWVTKFVLEEELEQLETYVYSLVEDSEESL